MVDRRTVRILCSALFLCTATLGAHEESLTEEAIRELAETYLDNPTFVSKGKMCNPSPIAQHGYGHYVPPHLMGPEHFQGPPHLPPPPHPGGVPPPPQHAPANQAPPVEDRTIHLQEAQIPVYKKPHCGTLSEGYTINFEDISVIQLIQFISKISGTNYIFDSRDLQFNITIVSEDQTSVADLTAALLQVLKMHNLSVVEQGNNVLIYRNQNMSKISTVITNENINDACDTAIITRVFTLVNVDPVKMARIVSTLLSPEANVEPSIETNHLIVTDITSNVNKVADLLSALDTAPTLAIDVREYSVRSANPATLVEYANHILMPLAGSNIFTLTPAINSDKIFIVATPYMISKTIQVLESLDVPEIETLTPVAPSLALENNTFYMYKLKYQNGQEIADALREVGTNLQYTGVANMEFVNTLYSIQWLEVNNSIVITGTEQSIHKVIALIDDLDQQPKQVYIEVLVIDTSLQNSLDFGVQWVALGSEQNKLAFGSGLLNTASPLLTAASGVSPPPSSTVPFPTTGIANALPTAGAPLAFTTETGAASGLLESFSLGFVGNIISHNGRSFLTLGALLSALDEEGDTSVLLNPKIMVEDTQPANFFVGQNIPYQTTSTVIQQTGSVTQNIQYEDIGVQLQVTPTIAPNNVVTLQINQTISDLATSIGNLTPTTNKELVTTRVHVPDGTFLVMSGHVRDTCSYLRSGIPCLGTLPLIGPAFSRTIEARTKRNLIFFIRPKVVSNIQEGVCLTNQEGYDYNWGSHPCSLRDCCIDRAPECEVYPAPPLCPPDYYNRPGGSDRFDKHRDHDPYNDNVEEDNANSDTEAGSYPFGRPKGPDSLNATHPRVYPGGPMHSYPPGSYPGEGYMPMDPYQEGHYPQHEIYQDGYGQDFYPDGPYVQQGYPPEHYPQEAYPQGYYPEETYHQNGLNQGFYPNGSYEGYPQEAYHQEYYPESYHQSGFDQGFYPADPYYQNSPSNYCPMEIYPSEGYPANAYPPEGYYTDPPNGYLPPQQGGYYQYGENPYSGYSP